MIDLASFWADKLLRVAFEALQINSEPFFEIPMSHDRISDINYFVVILKANRIKLDFVALHFAQSGVSKNGVITTTWIKLRVACRHPNSWDRVGMSIIKTAMNACRTYPN